MPEFDRFDICQAYYQLEVDYNNGGWLQERPSNVRRMEATSIQLARMKFKIGAGWRGYESLSENGKEIYDMLEYRYKFKIGYNDKLDADVQISAEERIQSVLWGHDILRDDDEEVQRLGRKILYEVLRIVGPEYFDDYKGPDTSSSNIT